MKKMTKLAMISSLVALGLATANGQETPPANVVLQLNFALTGFKQSDDTATPVRISNKEIIGALNASSNGFAFGRSAKLVLVQDVDNNVGIQIRERSGTNNVITDLSGSGVISVSASDVIVTGKNGTEYTILTFTFSDNNGNDFVVSGFATLRHGRATGPGVGTLTNVRIGAAVQVAGTGHVLGDPAVLKGTINASGPRAELVE